MTYGPLRAMATGLAMAFFFCSVLVAGVPEAIYLTWQEDPTSTMVINWITNTDDDNNKLDYKANCIWSSGWETVKGSHQILPVNRSYQVHRVILEGLTPGTCYAFRLKTDPNQVYTFQTMPQKLDEPLRFVLGGDIYSSSLDEIGNRDQLYAEMNQLAASYDPFCAFLGGDLAYAGNDPASFQYWLSWFKIWWQTMRGPSDRLIPMVTTLGNHDVEGAEGADPSKLLYFAFFPVKATGRSYYKLRFGDEMTMLMLDSGIVNDIEGTQRSWLKDQLSKDRDRDHLFVMYHHPAYPSVRSINGSQAKEIRKEWVPLFEKFGVDVAFENHDHAYKRTYPLIEGERDERGVVYAGDGAWGVNPRTPNNGSLPYFVTTKGDRYFLVMELEGQERRFSAIDPSGAIIDQWTMD